MTNLVYQRGYWSVKTRVSHNWVANERKSEAGSKVRLVRVNITEIHHSKISGFGIAECSGHTT